MAAADVALRAKVTSISGTLAGINELYKVLAKRQSEVKYYTLIKVAISWVSFGLWVKIRVKWRQTSWRAQRRSRVHIIEEAPLIRIHLRSQKQTKMAAVRSTRTSLDESHGQMVDFEQSNVRVKVPTRTCIQNAT